MLIAVAVAVAVGCSLKLTLTSSTPFLFVRPCHQYAVLASAGSDVTTLPEPYPRSSDVYRSFTMNGTVPMYFYPLDSRNDSGTMRAVETGKPVTISPWVRKCAYLAFPFPGSYHKHRRTRTPHTAHAHRTPHTAHRTPHTAHRTRTSLCTSAMALELQTF